MRGYLQQGVRPLVAGRLSLNLAPTAGRLTFLAPAQGEYEPWQVAYHGAKIQNLAALCHFEPARTG